MAEERRESDSSLLKRGLRQSQTRKVISGLIKVKEKINRLEQETIEEERGRRIPAKEDGERSLELEAILSRLDTIEDELKLIIRSMPALRLDDGAQSISRPAPAALRQAPSLSNLGGHSKPELNARGRIMDERLRWILTRNEFNEILEDLREEYHYLKEELDFKRQSRKIEINSSSEPSDIELLEARLDMKSNQIKKLKGAIDALPRPKMEKASVHSRGAVVHSTQRDVKKLETIPKWQCFVPKNKAQD